ncbi:sucrose:sucrose 1-fructosyltransferase-like [Lolium rigidum]|uniref:sucrose:sucrose 1-fructosyltransferase-like n=1 Tax=Lolium rigidum TaxID=89674 RepID=UPI001F5CBD16|nr:sucrose:sucrose 1-fructosyltransferase-like [Lolium rigidum]
MESRSIPGAYAYEPLPHSSDDAHGHDDRRSTGGVRWRACAAVLAASALVVFVVASTLAGSRVDRVAVDVAAMPALSETARSRGRDAGVSEKTSGAAEEMGFLGAGSGADADGFPWSNAMLQWQRTGFHFQPEMNWMNDPNGPVYYRGWYHLFYQYNPEGAVWGNIAWGHAVSRDLVHWRHLPLAMVPDQWYDINGVWTGSATVFPDGTLNMLYTGSTNASVQVQCLAVPEDPSDSLLRNWTKHEANPVLLPPPGIGDKDFRDPTTAWFDESDQTWRTVIGSKDNNGHAGIAMVYKTKDFLNYELIPGYLHRVDGTGMWECIDFYPVGGKNGSEELYVIKESSDDDRHDWYTLGKYDAAANTFTAADPENDLGIGLRYDWGKFYASKTFYDPAKNRRVLWGWIGETDSERADVAKGWASLMSIPRTVELDEKTRTNLIQWPVEELETLRINSTDLSGVTIDHGSVYPLALHRATQLDIEASFRLDSATIAALNEADVGYNCSTSGGSANRGALGPFGLLVLADGKEEQTAVYFYVAKGLDGGLQTHFCHDESRSTLAKDVVKRVVGYTVPILDGEAFSVRVLVDHSIVESFAMGGRSTATSRVYPTEAIYGAAGAYLFNNATSGTVTVEKLVVHEMDSSYNQIFMADDL